MTCECGNITFLKHTYTSDDEPTNNELWAELAKAERQRDSVTEDLKEVLLIVRKMHGCFLCCVGYATSHISDTKICDACIERASIKGNMDLPHADDLRRIAQIAKETMP